MMTESTTRVAEIARFTTQVYAALSHLPEPTRAELTDDLPAHLAEITADTSTPLEELLGDPRAYATELCATAGLPVAAEPAQPSAGFDETLRRLDARVGGWLGYPRLRDFLVALQPGWWAVRGGVVGVVATGFVLAASWMIYTPLALLLVFGALAGVILSVRLGRSHAFLPEWARVLVVAGNAILVFLVLAAFLSTW